MRAALAPREYERPLQEELASKIIEQHGRLFLFEGDSTPLWAQNVWFEPVRFEFKSISEAARELRGVQRNWWLHSIASHRRAKLIVESLPPIKMKPKPFPSEVPAVPLGSWTLLDDHTLLYSARCSSPYPDGEVHFVENKVEPPSRAYLKLWEAFTLEGRAPGAGEKVIDMGSSPGGWTWVLDQLGCEVFSVDKAPLSSEVKFSSRVKKLDESAFGLEPFAVDWFFSDIICYPERLLEMVKRWQPFVKNFVCTLKFQGPTDFLVIQEFLKIPGSTLRHLTANKHELTWVSLAKR